MGTLNVPQAEAAALKKIDTQELALLVEQCIRDEHWSCLRGLRLSECGPYVNSRLRAFEGALGDYAAAKSAKKRDSTGYDAYKTGSDLANAVQQVKHRVAIEEQEGELFFVDDQVMAPFSLNERLHVHIRFRWREMVDADWQRGSTTFCHTYVAPPNSQQPTRMRNPSAARQARDRQDELYRQWEYLRDLGLHAIRDHFRQGAGGATIPQVVQAKTDPYTQGLNNFSAQF